MDPGVIPVWASQADEMVAAIQYLRTELKLKTVALFFQYGFTDGDALNIATKTCAAIGLQLLTGVMYRPDDPDCPPVTKLVELLFTLSLPLVPEAIIVVVDMMTVSMIGPYVLNLLFERDYQGYMVVTSVPKLQYLWGRLTYHTYRLLLTQVMPSGLDSMSRFVARYTAAVTAFWRSLHQMDPRIIPDYFVSNGPALQGYLTSQLLSYWISPLPCEVQITAETLSRLIFNSEVDIDDISVGPLVKGVCHQGLRKVWLLRACQVGFASTDWARTFHSCSAGTLVEDCVGSHVNITNCSCQNPDAGYLIQVFQINRPASGGGAQCAFPNGATRSIACNRQFCPNFGVPNASRDSIKIGQLSSERGLNEYQFASGLHAAFAEFNTDRFRPCKARNFSFLAADPLLPLEDQLAQMSKAIAFSGNAGDTASMMNVGGGRPCLAPLTQKAEIWNATSLASGIIPLQATQADEFVAAIQYLRTLNVQRVALFYQTDLMEPANVQVVKHACELTGIHLSAMVSFSNSEVGRPFEHLIDEILAQSSPFTPEAVLIVGDLSSAPHFVYLQQTSFRGYSMVISYDWFLKYLFDLVARYGPNILLTQVMPSFLDSSSRFVAQYRAAVTTFSPSTNMDSFSMEGYLTGRLLRHWVSKVSCDEMVTATKLSQLIFENQDQPIEIEDLKVGPFVKGRCHQGLRTVWVWTASNATNKGFIPANWSMTFRSCEESPKASTGSDIVKFAQLANELSGALDFTIGLNFAFDEFNSNRLRRCPSRNLSLISNETTTRWPLDVQIAQMTEAVAYVGNAGEVASMTSVKSVFVCNR